MSDTSDQGESAARIRGIDFSGASRPGTDIWIAEGRYDGSHLRIESCVSAADAFGETNREPILRSLRSRIADGGTSGLDASFGLPAALLPDDVEDWGAALGWFCDRFDAADAGEMRETLKREARESAVEGVELKRRTDEATGASSPYSFITYYQTLYAIRDVVGPLVDSGVRIEPMGPRADDRSALRSDESTLLEVYPAATLRALGLPDEQYKECEGGRKRRTEILDGLSAWGVELRPADRDRVLAESGGDALDSVVAAVAVCRAIDRNFSVTHPYDRREGAIYE
ncbi:MAG: DUF429 domain-containing protein [Natronomonas sp.]